MLGVISLFYCIPLVAYIGTILYKKSRRPYLRWTDILAEIPVFNWAIVLGAAVLVLASIVCH